MVRDMIFQLFPFESEINSSLNRITFMSNTKTGLHNTVIYVGLVNYLSCSFSEEEWSLMHSCEVDI